MSHYPVKLSSETSLDLVNSTSMVISPSMCMCGAALAAAAMAKASKVNLIMIFTTVISTFLSLSFEALMYDHAYR